MQEHMVENTVRISQWCGNIRFSQYTRLLKNINLIRNCHDWDCREIKCWCRNIGTISLRMKHWWHFYARGCFESVLSNDMNIRQLHSLTIFTRPYIYSHICSNTNKQFTSQTLQEWNYTAIGPLFLASRHVRLFTCCLLSACLSAPKFSCRYNLHRCGVIWGPPKDRTRCS